MLVITASTSSPDVRDKTVPLICNGLFCGIVGADTVPVTEISANVLVVPSTIIVLPAVTLVDSDTVDVSLIACTELKSTVKVVPSIVTWSP